MILNERMMVEALRLKVLGLRDAGTGVWSGELASSALGTALATAVMAGGDADDVRRARAGAAWLVASINADGGWGDTPQSVSNLSATLIARSALALFGRQCPNEVDAADALARSAAWVAARAGSLEFPAVVKALEGVYGEDRTFSVPILTFLAICGGDAGAWPQVPQLPFLLALLPHGLFRFFRMQVVSYALPALIAMGLCRQIRAAAAGRGLAWGKWFAGPLLKKLARVQPSHGGFLDAIPLTAFVCLALRAAGFGGHPVAAKGAAFLRQSARADGSWAIDSNLRTWVTSLATRSVLANTEGLEKSLYRGERNQIASWLVNAQMKRHHPYTGAHPGGWAWTDLPGGVPDADDTSGALVALRMLRQDGVTMEMSRAVRMGLRWLMGLQNADGGVPTFCRGWGKLPFDRSCADITAHALLAMALWPEMVHGMDKAMARMAGYLRKQQAEDGSWAALWFGHQEAEGGRNPVIGTARVVDALCRAHGAGFGADGLEDMATRGAAWLTAHQRGDGAWGMGREPTVEETALAVTALVGMDSDDARTAAQRGRGWLCAQGPDALTRPAPVGLYFALLWYHEKMYPLVWSLEAFSR
ncbi:MAG: squalene--hopene cyclase [Kiritimatiellaeota bacterium]|nr:squalene--hopene cyclase [Kiritimatiellota bacterium]